MTANPSNDGQKNSPASTSEDPVRVPPTVFAQLEALRNAGIVNMFTDVQAGLERLGFTDARKWIETHPDAYVQGFFNGFAPTDPSAVETIDPETLAIPIKDDDITPACEDATTEHEQMLLARLERKRDLSAAAAEYYADGTWRETATLTADERAIAEVCNETIDCNARPPYGTAQLAVASLGRQYNLKYVEGYVMNEQLPAPTPHAWVELNGKVIELTFPDGPEPAMETAYLGVVFPYDAVQTQVRSNGSVEPLAPTP